MERAEEERGSCLGLRDELNSSPSPFSSVTENYIMNNFCFFLFYDVQETQCACDTTAEALPEPEMPLRSLVVENEVQRGALGELGEAMLVFREGIQSMALSADPKED